MGSNLVSTQWLSKHINDDNLIILDATIPKATDKCKLIGTESIPNGMFFDLKNIFSKQGQPFPNTVPSRESFEKNVQQLGVDSDSTIVIYDQHGVYSSPRAWWLFKLMGHKNVFVLDGGLNAWKAENLKTIPNHLKSNKTGNFKVNYKTELVKFKENVLSIIDDSKQLVIDARSNKRFLGTEPEPRNGLRAGHIPNSKNLHYALLTENGKLLSNKSIETIFNDLDISNKEITYSCGSGITACILALAGIQIGINDFSIYDGSWTEWGTLTELPIE